jgi:3-hydroxyisobutyrate dehydrogenase-like beta-hydroxyacid dehydrogenase
MSESQSQNASAQIEIPLRFGWVGLGQMGYPMATQLRRKLAGNRKMVVFDLDMALCERFVADWESENKGVGEVKIASSSREVAENSVNALSFISADKVLNDETWQNCFISIVPEGKFSVLQSTCILTRKQARTSKPYT